MSDMSDSFGKFLSLLQARDEGKLTPVEFEEAFEEAVSEDPELLRDLEMISTELSYKSRRPKRGEAILAVTKSCPPVTVNYDLPLVDVIAQVGFNWVDQQNIIDQNFPNIHTGRILYEPMLIKFSHYVYYEWVLEFLKKNDFAHAGLRLLIEVATHHYDLLDGGRTGITYALADHWCDQKNAAEMETPGYIFATALEGEKSHLDLLLAPLGSDIGLVAKSGIATGNWLLVYRINKS